MNLTAVGSLDELKGLISKNKERQGSIVTNFSAMLGSLSPFVDRQVLYYKLYDEGLFFFMDEGRYYNLLYFWNEDKDFPELDMEKNLLIEEQTVKFNDVESSRLERLSRSGFKLAKDNIQLEMDLLNSGEEIEEELSKRIANTKEMGFSILEGYDDRILGETIALWEEYLEEVDVPSSHMSPGPDDKLVSVLNEDSKVIATNFWTNTGRKSEGRHTVVDAAYSRRGLASLVLLYWYNDAKKSCCHRAIGWAEKNNTPSILAQEKLGAKPNGRGCKQYIKEHIKR